VALWREAGHNVAGSLRMPNWLQWRCFCTISALRAAVLPIVASRWWARHRPRLALTHDMGERRAEAVWDSNRAPHHPSIAQHKGPDVACCQNGIACDYGGLGYQNLSDDDKKVILSAYPRLDMKTCLRRGSAA